VSGGGIAVIIPVRGGGALLERVVTAVLAQRVGQPVDLLLVDSGSRPEELARLASLGARVERIAPAEFDHGATRDLGASRARGDLLVFLNQDALPVDERWLERLVAPFDAAAPPAAVQGGIREFPPGLLSQVGRRRFYWDSCGPRFYFTRESEGWIERHHGIGFSTVNCALRRDVWRDLPFGAAPILEDKQWQQKAAGRGLRIAEAPEAAVWHTHDYDVGALLARCASEGLGWRRLGERYGLGTALRDATRGSLWRDWRAGLRERRLARAAEIVFPLARPLALWWGNRWMRRVRL
jgi:rhamnosyltransferase